MMISQVIFLKRYVKVGRSQKSIERKAPILVIVSLPSEIVLRLLLWVMCSTACLSANLVFKPPFSCDGFNYAVLSKMSGDAGGGSFNFLLNLVNVMNVQGLEHVRIFLEFSGMKDTYDNITATAIKDVS